VADEPYPASDDSVESDDDAGVPEDEIEARPRPWWYRAGVVLLAVALVLFLVPAVAHVFFPPVNPHQGPPPGHFGSGCWACHDVTGSVPVKNYD
jgi:hypothetical protein